MGRQMTIPDEMRKKYVDRRAQDLAQLETALVGRDFDLFYKVGHQLRGNAETFGYAELATLGEAMEALAEAKDGTAAEECLTKLRDWLRTQRA